MAVINIEKCVVFFNCKLGKIDHGKFKDSDFDNVRQPEIADETGNNYISETITDRIKIPTANLGFTSMESLNKVSASDGDTDRQPEIEIIWTPKPEIVLSPEVPEPRQ